MSAPVTRLDLSSLLDHTNSPKHHAAGSEGGAKSAPSSFIPLHLSEVQQEQAPGEGEMIVVTPRSRSGSVASGSGKSTTPRSGGGAADSVATSSPRTPTSSRNSINFDRLQACSECGRVEHAHIHGACSWRCLLKNRHRGKDEASSPTDDVHLASPTPNTA